MFTRTDAHRVVVHGRVPATVHLPSDVPIERSAIEELSRLTALDGVLRVACTPDFHKGAGAPIGTVLLSDRVRPGVVGGDIGCGVRLDVLDLPSLDVTPDLRRGLRHAFFEGGREILVPDRARLLAEGLHAPLGGRTAAFGSAAVRAHAGGTIGGGGVSDVLRSYASMGAARCNVLGSVGGGNHFVEVQRVTEVLHAGAARSMGLRVGSLCVMTHSGSLDLGQQVGGHFRARARASSPAEGGLAALTDADAREYLVAADNCANFAMANRAMLAAMVAETLGCGLGMAWDSPHNLVWGHADGHLHRKGAAPAAPGEPVAIPGSSGSRSLLARGLGCEATMWSSPHGAGRSMGRNAARARVARVPDVVTRIDPATARADVRRDLEGRLREEAPSAYKPIDAVVRSVVACGMAEPVAWLEPVVTLKA